MNALPSGAGFPRALGTLDVPGASSAADAILITSPAQHLRATLLALAPCETRNAAGRLRQGIEATAAFHHRGATRSRPAPGPRCQVPPSHATSQRSSDRRDVAARSDRLAPCAHARPRRLQTYVSEDVVGVALGGAAKNVYAIACGMVQGAGLGESARAATMSRGFAELLRLGTALGARSETLMGLSGLGDLVLTATSVTSRNFSLGVALGKGAALAAAAGAGRPLAEGAATAPALVARAQRVGVELPIAEAVAEVLEGALDVKGAVDRLLSRPLKPE